MSRNRNETGSALVAAGCDRWTRLPSLTLARKLYAAHPLVWPNIEACRGAVLRRRGRVTRPHGRPGGPTFGASTCSAPRTPHKYAPLPKSDARAFLPYTLPLEGKTRISVFSDIHLPYHDTAALGCAVRAAKKFAPHVILLNGDTVDFHGVSRFEKNPHARNIKGEIEIARQFLDHLRDQFPKARLIWKDGNHDERLNKFICTKAPELFDLEEITLPHLLEFGRRGLVYVTDKRPIYLGALPVLHGHEWPTPVLGPVNAARGLFLRAKDCALVGHHHQTSEHTEPTVNEDIITTWSTGCLCHLHPEYAVFNKWNHGAADVEVFSEKDYAVHNRRIYRGKLLN